MPTWRITSPDGVDCGTISARSPTHALAQLHREALGDAAVVISRSGELIFRNLDHQREYGSGWTVEPLTTAGRAPRRHVVMRSDRPGQPKARRRRKSGRSAVKSGRL